MISHTYAKNILNALFKTSGSAGTTAEAELASFNLNSFSFETLDSETNKYVTKTVTGVSPLEYFQAYKADGYESKNNTIELNNKKTKAQSSQWYRVVSSPAVTYEWTVYENGKEKEYSKAFTGWYVEKNEQQKVPYPSSAFLALFTTMPDVNGDNYVEPGSGTTYIRVNLNEDIIAGEKTLKRAEDIEGKATTTNQRIIMYPEIDTAVWGKIKGFGVFDTQTTGAGKPIIWGPLKDNNGNITEVTTQANYVPLFRIGQFKITLG